MSGNELNLSLSDLNIQFTMYDFIRQMCKEKQFDIVKNILRHYIPIEPIDESGNTILHFIIANFDNMKMSDQSFKELLENPKIKKILNIENKTDGFTPAILACTLKLHNVIEMLEQAGADIHKPSKSGACVETVAESEQETQIPVRSSVVTSVVRPKEQPVEMDRSVLKTITDFFTPVTRNVGSAMKRESDLLTSLNISPESIKKVSVQMSVGGGSDVMSTETFINNMLNNINEKPTNAQNGGLQTYGNRSVVTGQRQLNNIPDLSGGKKKKGKSKKSEDTEISRGSFEIGRITQDIHTRAVETIKSLMNVDDAVAEVYKSVLYRRVKEEHPEFSGYERATEMEKLATKAVLKEIDIDAETKKRESERKENDAKKALSASSSDSEKKPRKKKSDESSSETSDESDKKTRKRKSAKTSTSSSDLDMSVSM